MSQQIHSLRSSRLRSQHSTARGESLQAKEELRQGLEALRQSRAQHLAVREEILKDLEGLEMVWDRRVVPSGLVPAVSIADIQYTIRIHI